MLSAALPPRIPLLIGATGHRDLLAVEVDRIRVAVRHWLAGLKERFGHASLQVVTSLSPGADLLVTEEALALDIECLAVLPVPGDLCRADFSDPGELRRFDTALSRCRKIIVCPLGNGLTLEDVSQPGPGRTAQYAAAGEIIASDAFILLALWDGRPPEHAAGTARTVEYRLRHRAWLDDEDDKPAHQELLPNLPLEVVYQIVTSRQTNEPAPGLTPLEEGYRTTLEGPLESIFPVSLNLVVARTLALNQDLQRYAAGDTHADLAGELVGELAGLPGSVAEAGQLFSAVDHVATRMRRKVLNSVRITGGATLVMGMCLLLFGHSRVVGTQTSSIIGFLIAFVTVFGFGFWVRRSEFQRRHLEARALAEGLRVELFWTLAGVPVPGGTPAAHRRLLKQADPGLEWIPNAIRAMSLTLVEARHSGIPGGIDFAIRKWIGASSGAGGLAEQLHYFRHMGRKKAVFSASVDRFSRVAVVLVLLIGVALTVGSVRQRPFLSLSPTLLLLTAGFIPLFTGLLEDYIQKTADRELRRQYEYMYEVFRSARDRLLKATSDAERRTILSLLGHAALAEHAEWLFLHRDRPIDRARLQ